MTVEALPTLAGTVIEIVVDPDSPRNNPVTDVLVRLGDVEGGPTGLWLSLSDRLSWTLTPGCRWWILSQPIEVTGREIVEWEQKFGDSDETCKSIVDNAIDFMGRDRGTPLRRRGQ